jgi:integrase
MARNRYTQRALDAELKQAKIDAAGDGQRRKLRDGDGLVLEVRPTGSASWQLIYSIAGKKRPYTIGPYPTVGLAEARDRADRARKVVERGEHPLAVDQAATAPAPKGPTVQAIADDYLADLKRHGRSDVYLRDVERAFRVDLLAEGMDKRLAVTVTPADCETILRRIEARGSLVQMRRFLSWARLAFDLAAGQGVKPNPWPARGQQLQGYKQARRRQSRPALRTPAQFAQLVRAIDGWGGSPASRAALLIHAHCWIRPGELREANWADVGDEYWTVRVILAGGTFDHLVPLTRQAQALFEQLRPLHASFVVPGMRHGKRISESTLQAALDALGYKGLHCTHGFRGSASTLLREMGWPGEWVERQLSHQLEDETEAAYNKALYLPQRVRMMRCWSDYLTALIDPKAKADEMLPHEWRERWESRGGVPDGPPARDQGRAGISGHPPA